MKTGTMQRTYNTNKTKWVVEGFSKQHQCPMYPNQGWSWTEWKSVLTDTYESFADAKSAISHGYIKDMIKTQGIVDIKIYEVITTSRVSETKIINCHSLKGKAITHVEPTFVTAVGDLSTGDYLVVALGGNNDHSCYAQIRSIRDGNMAIDIINGGWSLLVDISGEKLVVSAQCRNLADRAGEHVRILHVGLPDPTVSDYKRNDYNHQLNHYYENFNTDEVTSTLQMAVA